MDKTFSIIFLVTESCHEWSIYTVKKIVIFKTLFFTHSFLSCVYIYILEYIQHIKTQAYRSVSHTHRATLFLPTLSFKSACKPHFSYLGWNFIQSLQFSGSSLSNRNISDQFNLNRQILLTKTSCSLIKDCFELRVSFSCFQDGFSQKPEREMVP